MKMITVLFALGATALALAAGVSREKAVPYLEKRFSGEQLVMLAEVRRTPYGFKVFPREVWKCPVGVAATELGREINFPLAHAPGDQAMPTGEAVVTLGMPVENKKFGMMALDANGSLVLCPDLDRAALKAIAQGRK
jgi:hypothetical protein